ncbi:hypothetical protein QBC47DRAFT_387839 [Echria macrotheca]|uniref:Uncharacterized protein n=1 Tax=Echria macrotheca TaxID=438768 RepID=A0AAJ0BAE9_9PEZI|nr:hypothetical protein QBC47DRAFT_387839 [Echria macrotheca]
MLGMIIFMLNFVPATTQRPNPTRASDPQLFYMLRLCQQETTATKAADWLPGFALAAYLTPGGPLETRLSRDRSSW